MQMQGSLFAFFHLCLVSAHFSGSLLPEIKFYRNFSLVSVLFGGVLNTFHKEDKNPSPKVLVFSTMNKDALIVLGTNTFGAGRTRFALVTYTHRYILTPESGQ